MTKNLKRKITSLLALTMSLSMLAPLAVQAEETAAPISTVDGYLDVEVEDMPYDPTYFKLYERDLYSGGKALAPASEDKNIPDAKTPPHH